MFENLMREVSVILAMVISLAIIATLVSRNAETAKVISSGSEGFAKILAAATGPVSGSSFGGFTAF